MREGDARIGTTPAAHKHARVTAIVKTTAAQTVAIRRLSGSRGQNFMGPPPCFAVKHLYTYIVWHECQQ